jgi:hypothetical protein
MPALLHCIIFVSAGLRRMSSLSLRCSSPGTEGWADLQQDCLVAIIERFASKNDAAVSLPSSIVEAGAMVALQQ